MRPHPVNAGMRHMLAKMSKLEQRLTAAGVPAFLAQLPYWLVAAQYCSMMESKVVRIRRIGARIRVWLESVQEISARDSARLELLDIGQGMRNDIECTKRTLADLRHICEDVTHMFDTVGYTSRRLERLQHRFVALLSESYETATTLQGVLAAHDERALALLRQMQSAV